MERLSVRSAISGRTAEPQTEVNLYHLTIECYVDHLAVRSSHRNKGIGKQLLSWAIDFVNSHSEVDKLTLHVAKNNKRAIHMYQQMDFAIDQSNYSGIRHLLFKEANWHYMTRRLPLHPRSSINEKKY
ncbi:putative acetyltransferase [compost metagenome]